MCNCKAFELFLLYEKGGDDYVSWLFINLDII